MPGDKSVLIIGAGVAGLAARVYARLNGYRAIILEMHDRPGGMVTAWERQGYRVDGCIEFLHGSNPDSRWNQLWRELGVAQELAFVDQPELLRVRDCQGHELIFSTDLDRLEMHLLSLATGDAPVIRETIGATRAMASFDPPLDVPNPLARLGELGRMRRWQNAFDLSNQVTVRSFHERFKDPFLRQAFLHLAPPDTPMGAVLARLAFHANRNMGYPLGGSLALAQSIKRRFLALGGEILYQARVDQILTSLQPRGQGDRAAGVHLEDGRILEADWVISAADGRTTVTDLLNSQYSDETILRRYNDLPLSPPIMQVALGVRFELSGEPPVQMDLLRQPLYLAGRNQFYLRYRHYACDTSAAPPGRTVIITRLPSDYNYWQALGYGSTRYEMAKEEVTQTLIDHFEQRFPGITGRIEMTDVATPLTYARYTGSHHGIGHSFALSPQTIGFASASMDPTLPGLAGFFQIGQWTHPGGGVFPAARSGREIVRRLCQEDGKRFTGGKNG